MSSQWLLLVSAGAFIWGVTVFLTGGFALEFAGRRLSSTHAARGFWIAAIALATHYLFARGAHIGTHTVSIARLLGPWGRVYAFEPQRKIYRELYHNLALNGVTNAVILRYAVGSGDTRIIEMDPASSENEGGTAVGSGGDRAELRTLDSFGFQRVSLIKIDAERYENDVLDGAIDTIRRNRPVIVIEIVGGEKYKTASPDIRKRIHATWRKLERLGYAVTPVFNHDYIALPVE